MLVLVTGGAGYIGSHTVAELLAAGYEVVIADNFINSKPEVIDRLKTISGRKVELCRIDLCNKGKLELLFKNYKFDAVMHFAGLKAVSESISDPLKYYSNNLISTLNLCQVMEHNSVRRLIFSSSATIYGEPSELPLKETSQVGLGITNPYGKTKYQIETIIKDLAASCRSWRIAVLRYFNPIGAHPSGLIGEDPNGTPNNLLPVIQRVAVGKLKSVQVFGGDYPTVDGTGIRDYVHVVDIALGHLAALTSLRQASGENYEVYNLSTGKGTSVLELIATFEEVSGKKINYKIVDRRPGDVAECYASAERAKTRLGWVARRNVKDACRDAWNWQSQAS